MGFFDRLNQVIQGKANAILNEASNPEEKLDASYMKILEALVAAKRGLVDIRASVQKLEAIKKGLDVKIMSQESKAKGYVKDGKDDLAKAAIQNKLILQAQSNEIATKISDTKKSEEAIVRSVEKMESEVEMLKSKKEVIKAQGSAADAEVKIGESLAGLGESGNISDAIREMEDKTNAKQARADAITELTKSGVLTSPNSEIAEVTDAEVEAELAKLKNME
jgi:phage shock protein A